MQGYQLTWGNHVSAVQAAKTVQELKLTWSKPEVTEASDPKPGKPFALMYIPKLGGTWVQPVIEGSSKQETGLDTDDLTAGLGHYPATALPGHVGNFAVAGHRATHGQPFAQLDKVATGDKIYVQRGRHLVHVPRQQHSDRRRQTGWKSWSRSRASRGRRPTRLGSR